MRLSISDTAREGEDGRAMAEKEGRYRVGRAGERGETILPGRSSQREVWV